MVQTETLREKSIEEEIHCLEKNKFPKVYRNMNDTYQRCNLYKKMAKDVEKELERTTSF